MFLFLSFVVALIALYYLGVMTDAYNPDTTYLTPLVTLLVYSLVTMIREVRKGSFSSWLLGEDNYDYYHYPENPGYNGGYNGGYNSGYTYHSKSSSSNNDWRSRQESTVECFLPDKEAEKDNVKELTHYPSNQEVRDKMRELEKSRWFRIKRKVGWAFGMDIEARYRKEFKKPYKYKTNEKATVKSRQSTADKEDHNRFKPNNNWWQEKEAKEYNEVAKHVGRSCEIALADVVAEEYQPVNAEANGN